MKEFISEYALQLFLLVVILTLALIATIWLGIREWKIRKRLNFHLKVLAKIETDDVGRDFSLLDDRIQNFVTETEGASTETLVAEFLDLFSEEDLDSGIDWHIRKIINTELKNYFSKGSGTIGSIIGVLTQIRKTEVIPHGYTVGFLKNLVISDVVYGECFDLGILNAKKQVFSLDHHLEQISYLVNSLDTLKKFEQSFSLIDEEAQREFIKSHRESFEAWVIAFEKASPEERSQMENELVPKG